MVDEAQIDIVIAGLKALHEYLVDGGHDIVSVRAMVAAEFDTLDTDDSGYLDGPEALGPLVYALGLDPVDDEELIEDMAEFLGEKLDENWGGMVYPEYVVTFLTRVLHGEECPKRIPLLD